VPAAHFRFILKRRQRPCSSRGITLLSCAPMSITVSALRKCQYAPWPWQAISVLAALAQGTLSRP